MCVTRLNKASCTNVDVLYCWRFKMILKRLLLICMLLVCCVSISACDYEPVYMDDLLPIEDLSLSNKVYWLETFSPAENADEITYLVSYDFQKQEYERVDVKQSYFELIDTNYENSIIVVEYLEDGGFILYALDENNELKKQYHSGSIEISSIDALYNGEMYYCDGYEYYKIALSDGEKTKFPNDIRLGGLCVSPAGKIFSWQTGDDNATARVGVFTANGGKWIDIKLSQEMKTYCRAATWKDEETVLLAISTQQTNGLVVTRLYQYLVNDNTFTLCKTSHGDDIIIQNEAFDLLRANSLRYTKNNGGFISYVLKVTPQTYSLKQDCNIIIQSLNNGKRYLLRSLDAKNGFESAEQFTKAMWVYE